jgi:hypothetical protein
VSVHLPEDRDELLGRISIGSLLEQLVGPPRHLAYGCPSPNHAQTGRTPPVSIDETRGLWNCHGCGAGGTAIDALMVADSITTAEAFSRLREATGLDRCHAGSARPTRPARAEMAPPGDAEQILAAWTAARGWSADVVAALGLTVVRDGWGKLRVRFPFRKAGAIVWHQDRAVGDAEPKYLAPAGKSQQLYAMDLAGALETAQDTGVCWVVEGLPDVVALGHLADPDRWPGVIGLPGVHYRGLPQLAQALSGCTVPLVADADPDGEGMRLRAAEFLSAAGAFPVQVRLPRGVNDLDDLRRHVAADDAAFLAALTAAYEAGLDEYHRLAA